MHLRRANRNRRLRSGALVFALASALALPAPAAAGAPRPFFVRDGAKEAFYLDFAIRPQALTVGERTFVAYQGPGLHPYVAEYRHDTRAWRGPVRVGQSSLAGDTHGAPALAVDSGGYVHVFYGPHHDPMRHARSERPLDIGAWLAMPEIGSSTTYPQPVVRADGTLELFMREQLPGQGQCWTSRTSPDGGRTWSAPLRVLASSGENLWYAGFAAGQDGTVACAFVRVDFAAYRDRAKWARYDLHFLRRGTDGVWRDAGGAAPALPVKPGSGAALACRVVSSGSRYVNQPTPRIAADGTPGVLYLTGSGSGPASYAWRFSRYDGAGWVDGPIAETDHFFDSGTLRAPSTGGFEAVVVTGGSAGDGGGDRTYQDRGGGIRRWSSVDGEAWQGGELLSPAEPGTLYNQPQAAEGDDSSVVFMEWRNGASIEANRLFLITPEGFASREQKPVASRLAGADRTKTSVRVSRKSFPNGAQTVVVASGETFPDALVAGPLAVALDAPILLTPRTRLPSALADEIARLGARKAVVVGGGPAVDSSVARRLDSLRGVSVERIAGRDRYETAAKVAVRLRALSGRPDRVFVASGEGFADALSAGPLAAAEGAPILLTRPSSLPGVTREAVAASRAGSTLVVGGSAAVSESVLRRLPSPRRVGGRDRYETSRLLAELALAEGFLPLRALAASGASYPDGLAASTLGARLRAPLVLTPPAGRDRQATALLRSLRGELLDLYVIGGEAAVGDPRWRELRAAAFGG
ncbi:MAG: cell wall-binding repeat-containing protein [Coriobacteriia bacterium]|nr:cell wall-binding repeat-containing protein [Coriobacteriia bacterium]